MNKIVCFLLSVIVVACLIYAGINFYRAKTMPVWGNGEIPDPNWLDYFGSDNMSRLNFQQTQALNRFGQALADIQVRLMNLEDPNKR